MKVNEVKLSNRPYRVNGEYPSITVVFDYDVRQQLQSVMWTLGAMSARKLRKTTQHGYSLGISSVREGGPSNNEVPAWMSVTLPIEPGDVKPLQTYIDEATKIAEAAVPTGLAIRAAQEQEQRRVGDAIVVKLEPGYFRYELKGAKASHYGDHLVKSVVDIDDSGKVEILVSRSPSELLKTLQTIEAEAEAKRVEWDKYTPDQRDEMRRQKDIERKRIAAETRVAVEKLRADAKEWKWLEAP